MPNNLPLNWCECKLVDICDVYQPKTISTKELIEDGKYTVYGANGVIGRYNQYNHENSEILITCRGATCGTINKSKPFSWINGNAMVVHPFIKLSSDFLFYYLNSVNFKPYISGSAQPQITRISLQPLSLPLPPLAEQERIVAKIEALFQDIDEGVERLKSAQEQIKQYRQSVLKSAFEGKLYKTTDWKEVQLKDVCEFKSGNTIDTKLEKSSGSIPYIKVGDMNLSENSISIVTSSRFVDMVDIKQNQLIPTGSVIFPKRGGAIATNKKRKVIKPIIIDLNTMAIIPSDKLHTDFFYFWILKIDLMKLSNGGNIPQINNYSFDKVNIPLPSLSEQQHIVEEIEKRFAVADELEKAVNEGLEKADKLKQSILKKAFEGKLVAQNPNDEPASVLLERIKKSQTPTKGKKK